MSRSPPATCDPSSRPLPAKYVGERVQVHLNLLNGCYVVTVGGKVVGYTRALRLGDVTTRVARGGFERCRDEHVRNVHAYLLGVLIEAGVAHAPPIGWERLSYNCLTGPPCFVFRDRPRECFVSSREVLARPGAAVYAAPGRSR